MVEGKLKAVAAGSMAEMMRRVVRSEEEDERGGEEEKQQDEAQNEAQASSSSLPVDDEGFDNDWLSFSVSVAPLCRLAAVAKNDLLVMGSMKTSTNLVVVSSPEAVQVIQWVEIMQYAGSSETIQAFLFVGCGSGLVRVYDRVGKLCFQQQFHDSSVQAFKARGGEATTDSTQDFLIIYSDNIIVRLDASSLISTFINQSGRLDACKWKFTDRTSLNDAVCCGLDAQAQTSDFWGALYYKVLVAGHSPCLSVYAACDEKNSYSAKEVLSKLTSAAFSVAKNFLWGGSSTEEKKETNNKDESNFAKSARAFDAFEDPKRTVRSLFLDPSGRLCAASDNLGRVLLVDVEEMTILRIWKGYREAQTAWTNLVEGDEDGVGHSQSSSSGAEASKTRRVGRAPRPTLTTPAPAAVTEAQEDELNADAGDLCLFLYAPRRRILEVWHNKSGHRIAVERLHHTTRIIPSAIFYDQDSSGTDDSETTTSNSTMPAPSRRDGRRTELVTLDSRGNVVFWWVERKTN